MTFLFLHPSIGPESEGCKKRKVIEALHLLPPVGGYEDLAASDNPKDLPAFREDCTKPYGRLCTVSQNFSLNLSEGLDAAFYFLAMR
jgi:hypothetical protein